MASLKEIKGRIASVGGTLKITSAMKLVASAKLRKAQQAIGNMLPYEQQLHRMLSHLMAVAGSTSDSGGDGSGVILNTASDVILSEAKDLPPRYVAIVAFASNSSLCGAFNSNAVKLALSAIDEYRAAGLPDSCITVYSVGRKMADAMRKAGFPSPEDYTGLSGSPNYDGALALAQVLVEGFNSGAYDKVELIYNHYKSTASQIPTRKVFLPFSGGSVVNSPDGEVSYPEDMILEPSAEELLQELIPKVMRLEVYTTLLDSAAAEHAARTVAMQTATDNAEELLEELTLEYNKGRQQKITSEILDIVGGSLN